MSNRLPIYVRCLVNAGRGLVVGLIVCLLLELPVVVPQAHAASGTGESESLSLEPAAPATAHDVAEEEGNEELRERRIGHWRPFRSDSYVRSSRGRRPVVIGRAELRPTARLADLLTTRLQL